MKHHLLLSLGTAVATVALGMVGCGDEHEHTDDHHQATMPVELNFEAMVGDQPFTCGETYSGMGSTSADLTINDFRLYIHDLHLLTADGEAVAVQLTQDGKWQHDNVALLDFENCDNGTAEMNSVIAGEVAEGEYVGAMFKIGVPPDLNHANAATAPAPLNLTSMFWSWNDGYKFIRIDGMAGTTPFNVHLGSTGCATEHTNNNGHGHGGEGEGEGEGEHMHEHGLTIEQAQHDHDHDHDGNNNDHHTGLDESPCENPNFVDVHMHQGVTTTGTMFRFDLAALFSNADVSSNTTDTAPGCHSGAQDPDCHGVFESLGLHEGATQSFVSMP